MGLVGNLRTMSLPDIMQWIAAGRKTGTLHVERGAVVKRIMFRDGDIYSSWSNDPRESLGQFLVRDRKVSEEQLFRALLRQEQESRPLGAILVGDGVLTEDQLRASLSRKAEETIYDLFLWAEGQFEFKEAEVLPEVFIRVRMPVTSVVLEGIRRVDEWGRIREAIPTSHATFRVLGAPLDVTDPDERQALGLAASGKSLAEISMEMHRSEFEAASLLFALARKGALAVDSVGEEPPADTVTAIRQLLAEAGRLMAEKRFGEALEAYEAVLGLDRLNQQAKKGLIAVVEARNRERALRSVPLGKVPVLTMDLASLTREKFDPQEGFVLSRVNGQWDVQSILKLCPMAEEDALLIFARLLERRVIELR
jgi:hypothetical protein